MLDFFISTTRPKNWNFWSEGVSESYRAPVYLGDMPHTWTSAIYINAVRTMFVYEQDNTLLLGLGIDERWFKKQNEIGISNFPTYFGTLNYSVKKKGNIVLIKLNGKIKTDKIIFKSPLSGKIKKVLINGKKAAITGNNNFTFKKIPAEIKVYY